MRGRVFLAFSGLLFAALLAEVFLRVAARYSTQIAFLSRAGIGRATPAMHSLDEFIHFHNLRPLQDWRGYYTNSWGMNDLEFGTKVPGRTRILALGDSQGFSMVQYPANSLTIAEENLGKTCAAQNPEILNLGVAGAAVWDYQSLFYLAQPKLQPDWVLVNFYMANDAPDTYQGHLRRQRTKYHSYAYGFVRNSLRLLNAMDSPPPGSAMLRRNTAAIVPGARAGSFIPVSDNDPPLVGPTHSAEAWRTIGRNEVNTLYRPTDAAAIDRSWKEILETLEQMREQAARAGAKFALVFFPSEFQVYPESRREIVESLRTDPGKEALQFSDFDPDLPGAVLARYCAERNIPCFDLSPVLRVAAQDSSAPVFVKRDTHLNLRGNRLAGEAIGAFLGRQVCG